MNENDFDQYLADIMNAVYGEEVRGSIRSALEILHNMLTEAEEGIIDIKASAQGYAEDARDYAAQAMATTPEGYDTFALAIADVIDNVYIEQEDVDLLFDDSVIVDWDGTGQNQASEDPTYGSEGDRTGEP